MLQENSSFQFILLNFFAIVIHAFLNFFFCRYGKERFTVRLGEHDQYRSEGSEQDFDIECLHIHQRYDSTSTNNDIAVLKLKAKNGRGVQMNNYVSPACLTEREDLPDNHNCWISGWGNTGNKNKS